MSDESQTADPAIHETAVAIARRCVEIIEPLLRIEERGEAAREFYLAAREELERLPEEKRLILPAFRRTC